ncbi:LysR family transcriptional regulator [Hyphomonas jannaschiana]|jgi:DNA-binding transcriptional LysR family regulator|uniref:LysR family transcriptional regulator n=1 Tax=Hyphomonas jannaschiana VP2 TaxID=1280952 RepID=A0A059FI99_9PROT|nr:LysR family transcriptional regulator [Hyphomonas jannaschiana]KCZ90375.1 LysR family transcriptional regulator [Hyphomonas jannaschiana VP2]
MDIEVARTFLEVVKTGSFVGAASNLHLTQTAVSARIKVLEDRLERSLFIRNKSGAKLTPAGEQFFRFAASLVHVWDRARSTVALPPGRETVATVGAELSLWNPLLRHWMLWMRRECPELAVRTEIDTSDRLMECVQDGTLDVAVLYAAPKRSGVVTELLFEEKLVMARTTPTDQPLSEEDHVQIDWGDEFAASYQAAYPEKPPAVTSFSYGPLALEYILATGGSGYFRKGIIRSYLEEGRLSLVQDSPEFSYSAYMVHSTRADADVIDRVRRGLRASAEIAT